MRTLVAAKRATLAELKSKVQAITHGCSKPYFRKALERMMIETNSQNCNTSCDYIFAEQSEINLKDSTREGKISQRLIVPRDGR